MMNAHLLAALYKACSGSSRSHRRLTGTGSPRNQQVRHFRQIGTTGSPAISLPSTTVNGDGLSGIWRYPILRADKRFVVFYSELQTYIGFARNNFNDTHRHRESERARSRDKLEMRAAFTPGPG